MRSRPLTPELNTNRQYFVGLALASLFLSALAGFFVYRQIEYERSIAFRQLAATNQARVSTFEQYALRTLDLAAVSAKFIKETGNLTDFEDLELSESRSQPFTLVFLIESGRVRSSQPGVDLTDSERNELISISRKSPYDLWVTPPITISKLPAKQLAIVPRTKPGESVPVILLEPGRFTQFADEFSFEPDDLISMIGLDGITRARRTGTRLTGGETVKGLVMERQMAAPDGSYVGPSVLDGKVRYFSHRRLSEYGLFVTSGRPMAFVDQRIEHRKLTLLAFLVFALLVIIGGAITLAALKVRRQARLRALLIANRRLREAQKIGKIGDWDLNLEEGKLYWSDELLRMYGRDPAKNVTTMDDIGKYVRPEDVEMIRGRINQVVEEGVTASWDIETILDNGEESMRRINAAPIRNAAGKIIGVHGTDQDITSEAKLRDLELRLAEVARLDAMSALAATLAHELNQPLGVATNYVGAARSLASNIPEPKIGKYLEGANLQLEHLSQIVSSARELVMHSASSMKKVNFKTIFASAIELLKSTDLARNSYFSTTIAPDLPPVMANETQIKQVLFNLGRNAMEAVPDDIRPEISFHADLFGNEVRIRVRDNGTGIAGLDRDPFDAMTTTKASGLGLGLSLARTIIEAHGGRIWIEETGHEGTTIAFTVGAATS